MKNLQLIFLGVMILVLTGTAHAMSVGDENANNSNTGEGSTNKSDVSIENSFSQVNENDGTVDNALKIDFSTGENQANENGDPAIDPGEGGRGGGSVTSGDASFDVEITNTVNTNTTQIALEQEPEEGGRGGGPGDEPVVTTPPVELTAAGTPATLPSSGPDFLNQMIALIGLPLLGTMALASVEVGKRKKLVLVK